MQHKPTKSSSTTKLFAVNSSIKVCNENKISCPLCWLNGTNLTLFVVQMLSQNLQYTDAAMVSLVYDAAKENDIQKILLLDDECTAIKLPKEIRAASNKLGLRLLKIFQPLCKNELLDAYAEAIKIRKLLVIIA